MRKIYLASSWRNAHQPGLVAVLRSAGHAVYDFRNPAPGDDGFHWSEIDRDWLDWSPATFARQIETHPVASDGFSKDKAALKWADTGILLLPCGRSAHLEAGWMIGQGKSVAILLHPDSFEPELMYLLAARRFTETTDLLGWLVTLPWSEQAA